MNEKKRGTQSLIHSKKWEADLQRLLAQYFKDKGKPVLAKKPYIIKKHFDTDWHYNIILETVWKYIEEQKTKRHEKNRSFALHKYVHHGLSSQAFLFNLLGPLVVDKRYGILDEIVRKAGIQLSSSVSKAEFEVEDPKVFNEVRGQPTSIDLCLYTKAGEGVFIEFKFTEKNFGGCSVFGDGDCDGRNPAKNFDLCYLHKIEERNYWTLMKQHGLLTKKIKNSLQCPLSTLYQLYRLILFALEKKGHFLLLCDERNPSFLVERDNMKRGLFNLAYETLPSKVQDKCYTFSVQSILPILEKHSELVWTSELKNKYFG